MEAAITRVHVRLPSHRCLTVDVPGGATAADVVALAMPHMRSDASACLRVWHRGRVLVDSHPVLAHVRHGDTLQLVGSLCGGGGDGGATGAESRSSYLEMYKPQATGRMDAREELLALWTCCRLTRQPLGGEDGTRDVVACPLGYLYDKEAVLTALKQRLLDEQPMPALASHIESLKDVTTLQLTQGGARNHHDTDAAADATDFRDATHVRFVCPVTEVPMNGRHRFVALRPSGVVVAERALKQVPDAVGELLHGQPLDAQQVLPLNATPDELDALRAALAASRVKKKRKNAGDGHAKAPEGEAFKRASKDTHGA